MVNKIIRALLVVIINGSVSLDQGTFCGCRFSAGEGGPKVKANCMSVARNSGQSARHCSPSKNSSPGMKIEGSIPARNDGSMSTRISFGPKYFIDAKKGGGHHQCGGTALTSFESCNIFFCSLPSLCFKL